MFGILGLILSLGVIAALSLGLALILNAMAPKVPWRKRALLAALGAVFIPFSLPIITVSLETGFSQEWIIAVGAMLVSGFALVALVAFPTAYFFIKRREPPDDPTIFS